MPITTTSQSTDKPIHSVTFRVHDVEPATMRIPTTKLPDAVSRLLQTAGSPFHRNETKLESCCDYTTDAIEGVNTHALIAATHRAFSEHRPLVLSPDMLWLAVLQGIAQHVHVDPESSRHLFVNHDGRMKIETEIEPLFAGSPENPWAYIVSQFSERLRSELGQRYDRFECEFSTTGPLERLACQIAIMDMVEPFFEYKMGCICGIPQITLDGTPDDWKKFRSRLSVLNEVGMAWWFEQLDPIAVQFIRAANGHVNLTFWQNIHKRMEAYGGDNINGWMVKFIPYIEGTMGLYNVRNPLFEDDDATITSRVLPSGISAVPIHYDIYDGNGCQLNETYEVLGGFIGVTQNEETLALRPKVGWAVRPGGAQHRLYRVLEKFKPEPPLPMKEFQESIPGRWQHPFGYRQLLKVDLLAITRGVRPALEGKTQQQTSFPGELRQFYRWCNGVTAFRKEKAARFHRIAECDVIVELPLLGSERVSRNLSDGGPQKQGWLRFATFADGSFAMIPLHGIYRGSDELSARSIYEHWIVLGGKAVEVNGQLPIVARSFHEFLRLLIDADGDVSKLKRLSLVDLVEPEFLHS